MAAIEYGIDKNGKKIYAEQALRHHTYICPYCHESIGVRKGSRKAFFAHSPIENRTPAQMMCPGYLGGKSNIQNETDQVYITNGGIPLYLSQVNDASYEIYAIFPTLSDASMELIRDTNAYVEIYLDNGEVRKFSAWSIKKVRITSIDKWIKVRIPDLRKSMRKLGRSDSIREIRYKWEWGIRGIDIDNDIFQVGKEGGYRLAQHADIIKNKEYYTINRKSKKPNVDGIIFTYCGKVQLSSGWNLIDHYIIKFKVIEITNAAIAFIQTKGYQLIEQDDEIIPLWPPAVVEGKELKYRNISGMAYFYHKNTENQQIFKVDDFGMSRIHERENVFVSDISNQALSLTDYKFNQFSREIRYMIVKDANAEHIDYELKATLQFDKCTIDLTNLEEVSSNIYISKTEIRSNVSVEALLMRKNFIEASSHRFVNQLKSSCSLILDFGAFGVLEITKLEDSKEKQADQCWNLNTIYNIKDQLTRLTVPNITYDRRLDHFLNIYKKLDSEIYRLILYWRYRGKMPIGALEILTKIEA